MTKIIQHIVSFVAATVLEWKIRTIKRQLINTEIDVHDELRRTYTAPSGKIARRYMNLKFYDSGRLTPLCMDCDEKHYVKNNPLADFHTDLFTMIADVEEKFAITIEVWETSHGKNYQLMSHELIEWDQVEIIADYVSTKYVGMIDPSYYSSMTGKKMEFTNGDTSFDDYAQHMRNMGARVSQKLVVDYSGTEVTNDDIDIKRITCKTHTDSLIVAYRDVLLKYYGHTFR